MYNEFYNGASRKVLFSGKKDIVLAGESFSPCTLRPAWNSDVMPGTGAAICDHEDKSKMTTEGEQES